MPFMIKLILSLMIIACCASISKRFPSLGGLIATMPLTSLLVLLWLYADNPGDYRLLGDYTRGVLWGIIPTILFFLTASYCLRRGLPFPLVLTSSFCVWLAGAAVHQFFLK